MATTLRLPPPLADGVRSESERTGRSQQDVIRDAVDRYLSAAPVERESDTPRAEGRAFLPREPYARPTRRLKLPDGQSSLDLLERDDRF